MKDYYYILGVARTASSDEIKQAYRKLSLKFHPDKNGGDKFFEDRFKEINEAYEILSNLLTRGKYDAAFFNAESNQTTTRSNAESSYNSSPLIISFSADKSYIAIGDEITFRWHVEKAFSVELKPFGAVPTSGQKKIKILGFNSISGLEVELVAKKRFTSEFSSERIIINKLNKHNPSKKSITNKTFHLITDFVIDNLSTFIKIIIFFASIACLNYLSSKKSNVSSTTTESTSTVEAPQPSPIQKPIVGINTANEHVGSVWKGHHLENGNSPFNNCFGKGKRSGRSWILFKNRNDVDAVVCLTNSVSGKTIRNEYIRAGSEFTMSSVPSGSYTLKIVFGKDWSSEIHSPCGSNGFFESEVSFSASDGYNDIINVETINNGYSISYSTHTITLYMVRPIFRTTC